jgi:formate-dependent nitrite reductase membrane component NrfD
MALREWMVPHEWMIKPTPQTEWIDRRGILVWMAEVFSSLGAGLYLVSLFYNNLQGMLLGYIIIIFLKMPPHFFYFGKPLRFWRAIPPFTSAWKTSWLTRGVCFTLFFIGFGFIQLALSYWLPGTGWEIAFKVLAGLSAFLVGIYAAFAMGYCRSIPLWNSALLPIVFVFVAVADGFALIMAIGLYDPQVNIFAAEAGSRILLAVNAILIAAYLWKVTRTSKTGHYSARLLLRGRLALPFWVGVVVFGLIVPLAVSISSLFVGEASVSLLITGVVLHTMGTAAFKYCLLKAGIHAPVLPATISDYY